MAEIADRRVRRDADRAPHALEFGATQPPTPHQFGPAQAILRLRAMTDLAHPDRIAKLAQLRAQGLDPYPARGVDAEPIASVVAGAGTAAAPGPRFGARVTLAGRLLSLRDFGKLI